METTEETTEVTAPMTETKPGPQTTEFWMSVAVHVVMLLNLVGIWNYMPNRYSAFVMAGVQLAYSLSRGWAKSGVAYALPKPVVSKTVRRRT